MNAFQKDLYNEYIVVFNKAFMTKDLKYLRFGQAFYNCFCGSIYTKPKPELFYEKDPIKAIKIICEDIEKYILTGKAKNPETVIKLPEHPYVHKEKKG